MGVNDITGDKLISKVNSKEFTDNWEKIFGKKDVDKGKEEAHKNAEEVFHSEFKANQSMEYCPNSNKLCAKNCKADLDHLPCETWDEKRIDMIGQNGNEGIHYENTTAGY